MQAYGESAEWLNELLRMTLKSRRQYVQQLLHDIVGDVLEDQRIPGLVYSRDNDENKDDGDDDDDDDDDKIKNNRWEQNRSKYAQRAI